MNTWGCKHSGCKATASGVGGAMGLRAIGWFFDRGSQTLLCPEHRTDRIPCRTEGHTEQPCALCAGVREASLIQRIIYAMTGQPWPTRPEPEPGKFLNLMVERKDHHNITAECPVCHEILYFKMTDPNTLFMVSETLRSICTACGKTGILAEFQPMAMVNSPEPPLQKPESGQEPEAADTEPKPE